MQLKAQPKSVPNQTYMYTLTSLDIQEDPVLSQSSLQITITSSTWPTISWGSDFDGLIGWVVILMGFWRACTRRPTICWINVHACPCTFYTSFIHLVCTFTNVQLCIPLLQFLGKPLWQWKHHRCWCLGADMQTQCTHSNDSNDSIAAKVHCLHSMQWEAKQVFLPVLFVPALSFQRAMRYTLNRWNK